MAYVRFASVYRRFQDLDAFRKELDLLKETVDTLMNAVKRFGGSRRQEDDLTAVVIRIVE